MDDSAKAILERLDMMKEDRQRFEKKWEDIAKYTLPKMKPFGDADTRARDKTRIVSDSTGIKARRTLVDGLLGYLVGPTVDWLHAEAWTDSADDIPGLADWYEKTEKTAFAYLRQGKFYHSLKSMMDRVVTIGWGSLYIEEARKEGDRTPVCAFIAHPVKEIYYDENADGNIDVVFRLFTMSVRQLVQEFGYDTVSREVRQFYDNGQYSERIEIIHAVFPREEAEEGMGQLNMPWASFHIEKETGAQLREGGYDYMPYLIWRWTTENDEVYGTGITEDCLMDLKNAHILYYSILKGVERNSDPPMLIHQSQMRKLDMRAGATNVYVNEKMKPEPILIQSDQGGALQALEMTRKDIREFFYNDFFLMFAQLERQITAAETYARLGEKGAMLSSLVGSFYHDFALPFWDIFIQMLKKKGIVKPFKPEGEEANKAYRETLTDIVLTGPLALAQQRAAMAQSIGSTVELITPLMQIKPDVLDNFDFDKMMRFWGRSQGIPETILKEMPEIQKLRDERARQQQQAMQMQQAMQAAQVSRDVSTSQKNGMARTEEANAAIMGGQQ